MTSFSFGTVPSSSGPLFRRLNDPAVRRASAPALPVAAPPPSIGTPLPAVFTGAPLNPRLTLARFVVSPSNHLAFETLGLIARNSPLARLRNPLVVHGAAGLGKTHLLQGLAHAVTGGGRRAAYLGAGHFSCGLDNAAADRSWPRGFDCLVLDDVHGIVARSARLAFARILAECVDGGRQLVVALDRPPGELDLFDAAVRSRLAGGLLVGIGFPDVAAKAAMVHARVRELSGWHPAFCLGADIVDHLTMRLTTGRDLEAAVNRLEARASLTGRAATIAVVEALTADLAARAPRLVRVDDIQRHVGLHYGISRSDILSERRTAIVVKPRHIAMYLARALTLRSFPDIGRRFGGRDHTTVLHAVRKIERLRFADPCLDDDLMLIERRLTED